MKRDVAERGCISRNPGQGRRRGASLVIVLVMLAMIALLAVTLTSTHAATKRLLLRRHHGRQADLLARAGVEFAVAELLDGRDAGFRATYRPMDRGTIEVVVGRDAERSDQVEIHSSAVYPDEGMARSGREVRRVYRIVRDEQGAPRECVFVSGRSTREPQFVRADDPRRRIDPEEVHAQQLAVVRRALEQAQKPAKPGANATPGPEGAAALAGPTAGGQFGGPWVIPFWIELLKDDDPAIRAAAANALKSRAFEARQAVPALAESLEDEDASVRRAAREALKEIRNMYGQPNAEP